MKNKKYIILIIIILLNLIYGTNSVQAVLQSNGGTNAVKTVSDWMLAIRKMEELGGVLGLYETLNTDLTSSSGSNNLDCHMQKNTEYGAMAILSASAYGNPEKIEDGGTTTGNETGIVMKINKEWVTTGHNVGTNFVNAASRYKEIQSGSYIQKNGDAITETSGWHGSTSSQWLTDWRRQWLNVSSFLFR